MSASEQNRKRRRPAELRALAQALEVAEQTVEPLQRVRKLSQVARLADAQMLRDVERARADGYSWTAIGAVQGVSGQAAQQRFARQTAPRKVDDSTAADSVELDI